MDLAFHAHTLHQVYLLVLDRIVPLKPPAPFHQMIVLEQVRLVGDVNPHHRYRTGTIFLGLPTLSIKLHPTIAAMSSVFKNTPPHSNVLSVPRDLLALTIYVLICVPIPMNALLYAQYAARLLHVSMIESVMRVFTQGRRNLYAKASLSRVASGAVVVALLEQML
jgi:hypothetical protein